VEEGEGSEPQGPHREAHSWVDALASAGAVIGLIGVSAGLPIADTIAGFAISSIIVWIGVLATRDAVTRLFDAQGGGRNRDLRGSDEAQLAIFGVTLAGGSSFDKAAADLAPRSDKKNS
jgi:hypothetical protein